LADETIGFLVSDKTLSYRIESERSTEPDGDLAQVDQGTRPMTVLFVQSKFFSASDRI
jgi:hypothetical protein